MFDSWYQELLHTIKQSECKAGYFDKPINVPMGGKSYPAKNICLKGKRIIASGNKCPQIEVSDEDTCKAMVYSFKPCKNE